ncbi:MAG: hypothetical protein QW348_08495 [Ignisphaera sp.]
MKLLFNASALLNILRIPGEKTLTPYEIGNTLWKEATLLNRISLEETTQLLNT